MRFKSTVSAILLLSVFCSYSYGQFVQSQFPVDARLSFIQNMGQLNDEKQQPLDDILYYAIDRNVGIYFRNSTISFVFYKKTAPTDFEGKQDLIRFNQNSKSQKVITARADLSFSGANPNPEIEAFEPKVTYLNFYLEHTGEKGICDIRQFGSLLYKEIYKNIDLEFIIADSGIKYNFIIHQGGRVEDIKMKWLGADIHLNGSGELVYKTALGELTESAPVIKCKSAEKIIGRFHVISRNVIGFVLDKPIAQSDIIIDPVIKWSTYYGGNSEDDFNSVFRSTKGELFAFGNTASVAGISTTGAFQDSLSGDMDVFITKFTESGVRIWSTYFGGDSSDWCYGTLMDDKNRCYVSGLTNSIDMGTSGAWQTSRGGMDDNFIAQFNDSGKRNWCSYIGGSNYEWSTSLTLDTAGNIVVAGMTSSSGMATTGAYQTAGRGGWDLYLAKFNDSGNKQLVATYFGGNSSDFWPIVTSDKKGRIYAAGNTWSDSFISKSNVHQKELLSSWSPMLASFDQNLKVLNWATYFGGSGETGPHDLIIDDSGYLIMAGWTYSDSLIAFGNAFQKNYAGSVDGFLSKFRDTGAIVWSTYFGGSGWEGVNKLHLMDSGKILVAGGTNSKSGIADSCSMRSNLLGSYDAFIAEFRRSGHPVWSTYWGGNKSEGVTGLAVEKNNIYIAGYTDSDSGIATPTGFKSNYYGNFDGFLAKLHRVGRYYDTMIVNTCEDFTFRGKKYTTSGKYDIVYKRCLDTIYMHLELTFMDIKMYKYRKSCDSFKYNSKVYKKSGYYTDTVHGKNGCDTIYTFELTIVQSRDTAINVLGCDSFVFQNQTISSSGDYVFTTKTKDGCDSTITLSLKIEKSVKAQLDTTVCYFLNLNKKRYTSSGTYIQYLVAHSGCDSVLEINLTVLSSSKSFHDLAYCDSALINGIVYRESGDYTQKIKNYLGCDSLIFLTLEIRQSTDTLLVVDVCDSFVLNDITYMQTGRYMQKLFNHKVCDSVIHLELNLRKSSDSFISIDTCREVTVNGTTYTLSGNYEQYLVNSENCDSVLRLKIELEDFRWKHLKYDACGFFQDPQKRHYWTESGTYYDTVHHQSACDSIYEYRINFIELDTHVIYSGNTTLMSADVNAAYQWLDCDRNYLQIPGETGRYFAPERTGNYAVKLDAFNCTDTSDCYYWKVNHVQIQKSGDLLVYPNPVNAGQDVILQYPGETGVLDLYDLQGRKIGSFKIEDGVGIFRPQQAGLLVIRAQTRGKSAHALLEVR